MKKIDKIEPIDAVILWVDGSDEAHFNKLLPYLDDKKFVQNKKFRTRYDQVEEIKYTVDSILKFATFIRNIYIVTDNQIPSFLTNDVFGMYKKVSIVDHQVIFKNDEQYLPTFNCRPIETKIYKIPNLAEHFIYFNDDMILINKTAREDFFINSYPVIRGKWQRFDENVFYKKLNNKEKKKISGHKIAQQKAAKIVGFHKYYKFHHTPYPLRKSTFENFFKENKSVEQENIKYRFRDVNQFTPQGLANHIEIKNKTCILKKEYQLAYIQSYKKMMLWYKIYFLYCGLNPAKLFMCLQSLDQCPPKKLTYILGWLHKRINN